MLEEAQRRISEFDPLIGHLNLRDLDLVTLPDNIPEEVTSLEPEKTSQITEEIELQWKRALHNSCKSSTISRKFRM